MKTNNPPVRIAAPSNLLEQHNPLVLHPRIAANLDALVQDTAADRSAVAHETAALVHEQMTRLRSSIAELEALVAAGKTSNNAVVVIEEDEDDDVA